MQTKMRFQIDVLKGVVAVRALEGLVVMYADVSVESASPTILQSALGALEELIVSVDSFVMRSQA